jgi:hypothetical protein
MTGLLGDSSYRRDGVAPTPSARGKWPNGLSKKRFRQPFRALISRQALLTGIRPPPTQRRLAHASEIGPSRL